MFHMESVRLEINEHMTAVGEEIVSVVEKQQQLCGGADVCSVKKQLNVRVFVLERLSAAAEVMCSLFLREMETLQLHNTKLHTAGMSVTHTHTHTHLQAVVIWCFLSGGNVNFVTSRALPHHKECIEFNYI